MRSAILDWDGTLADTSKGIVHATINALATFKVHVADEEVLALVGGGSRSYLRELFWESTECEPDTETLDQLVALKDGIQAGSPNLTTIFPKTPVLLEGLRGSGVRIGLATMSARKVIVPLLEHHGLGSAFDVVVTVDQVKAPKPDAEIIYVTQRELGGMLDEILFYAGDSDRDFGVVEHFRRQSAVRLPFVFVDSGIFLRDPEERKQLRDHADRTFDPGTLDLVEEFVLGLCR